MQQTANYLQPRCSYTLEPNTLFPHMQHLQIMTTLVTTLIFATSIITYLPAAPEYENLLLGLQMIMHYKYIILLVTHTL